MLPKLSSAMPSQIANREAARGTILNYVLCGEWRSGLTMLQSSLSQLPGVVCHRDLLFDEYGTPEEQDDFRKAEHEAYYGSIKYPDIKQLLPEWFSPPINGNLYRYLTDQVFDNPRHRETKVGIRLLYRQAEQYSLYDLFRERCREGDFCLIHLHRNPIKCFLSLERAKRSRIWRRVASKRQRVVFLPVMVTLPELVGFIRRYEMIRRKIDDSCRDVLDIRYKDLVDNYASSFARVMRFLEIDKTAIDGEVPLPLFSRLTSLSLKRQIINYDELNKKLPKDMQRYLTEEEDDG